MGAGEQFSLQHQPHADAVREQDGDEIVAVAFGIAPLQRHRHHVAVVLHGSRDAEFVFQNVGEGNVGLRCDRRPQHGACMRVGDALDSHRDARDAVDIEVGIVEATPQNGDAFADQLVARHCQSVEPPLLFGDHLAGIVDDGNGEEIQ